MKKDLSHTLMSVLVIVVGLIVISINDSEYMISLKVLGATIIVLGVMALTVPHYKP